MFLDLYDANINTTNSKTETVFKCLPVPLLVLEDDVLFSDGPLNILYPPALAGSSSVSEAGLPSNNLYSTDLDSV